VTALDARTILSAFPSTSDGVLYLPLAIEIDIYADDLGHPELPDLLDVLKQQRRFSGARGREENRQLLCLYCWRTRASVEWMYLRQNPSYQVVHLNSSIRNHGPRLAPAISDKHRVLVERSVAILEREGFHPQVEQQSPDRKIRSDFRVLDSPQPVGGEVQVSSIATGSVTRRTKLAHKNNLAELWISDLRDSASLDGVARIMLPHGDADYFRRCPSLTAIAGYRGLEWMRCGDGDGGRCPDNPRRRYCGSRHWYPVATDRIEVERLLIGYSTRQWRPIRWCGRTFLVPSGQLERAGWPDDQPAAQQAPPVVAADTRDSTMTRACDRRGQVPQLPERAVITLNPARCDICRRPGGLLDLVDGLCVDCCTCPRCGFSYGAFGHKDYCMGVRSC
jgi:hypothetical protein